MVGMTYTYKLSAYPKELTLRDGRTVVLKPMMPEDGEPLMHFFQQVPADDRYYLKEDVTSPKVMQRWTSELDYDRTLPLLAWLGGQIVADASLHRTRALARRHVGEVNCLFVAADPPRRVLDDGARRNRDLRGKEPIPSAETAGHKDIAGRKGAALLPGHHAQ